MVDHAKLVGIVRREALEIADPGVPVSELMEEPVSVPVDAVVHPMPALRRFAVAAPTIRERKTL